MFTWGSDADGPVLEIVVRNVGTKQGAIQAVYIRTPHLEPELESEEWDLDFLRPAFGVVLDTDQVTSPLLVPLGTARRELERLLRALTEGRAKLAIESTRGEVEIPIPATEQGPPPPTI